MKLGHDRGEQERGYNSLLVHRAPERHTEVLVPARLLNHAPAGARRCQEGGNDLREGKAAEPQKALRPELFFVVDEVIVDDKYPTWYEDDK